MNTKFEANEMDAFNNELCALKKRIAKDMISYCEFLDRHKMESGQTALDDLIHIFKCREVIKKY